MSNSFGRITEESSYEKSITKLDDYQRAAATSDIENIAIKAPAGSGKALCNGTKVLTNSGWKNIESLLLSDLVAGSDGKFHKLLGIYPQGKKQIYRVIFSDNSEIKCSPDHLWTYFKDFIASYTKTIQEIYETGELEKYNIYIPTVGPIDFDNSSSSNKDIDYYDYGLKIKEVDCIPDKMKNAAKRDREILFCGIIQNCDSTIIVKSYQLALDIQYLCESLGYTAILTAVDDCIEVAIKNYRKIKNIIPTNDFDDMTCIAIDAQDHLFVTEHFILTHNTTTLIAAIASYRYNYINDKICAITYTRAARAEMEARLQELEIYDVDVTTIHVWSRNILEDLSIKYDFKIRIMQEPTIKAILRELVDEYTKKSKVKFINIDILYNFIFGSKKMDITDNYKRTLSAIERRYLQYKEDNYLYDFTDYPKYLYDVLMTYNETIKNIDALFVDEFQDIDEKELKLFNLVETNKKFFIGDAWQCQPFGTKVIIKDKKKNSVVEKNIECINKDDLVLSCQQRNNKKGFNKILTKKVIDKQIYSYQNDYIISISTANNAASSYTSNHKAIVHIENIKKYVLCLVLNENNYCKLQIINLADKNHFKELKETRGNMWFLELFDNEQSAKNKMIYISNCYYISNKFEINNLKGLINCLEFYKLSIKYPLIDYNNCNDYFIQTCAINLLSTAMSCIVINENDIKLTAISGVTKTFIDKTYVCGLKIEDGLYVADNILTHNSIFQFRGADGEVFNKLDNFTIFKLKQNYRSYQEIIDYATNVYLKLFDDVALGKECYISTIMDTSSSKIKCVKGNGGELYVINPYGYIYSSNNNFTHCQDLFNYFLDLEPMILCRTNKQVKQIKELGYFNVDTIHQAKGLEYDDVIVLDTTITSTEDLNIAYVAMTRAKNRLLIINWQQFELLFKIYMNHNSFGGF